MTSLAALKPGASVIIPAYESHGTVAATLQSLRNQTLGDTETILIDSSVSGETGRIAANFPEVRYHRSTKRLFPHEARSVGVGLARSDILVFTDPDVVAAHDWLEVLLRAYAANKSPVAGAVASLQRGWLEMGVHFAKFDLWLPGGERREVPVAPTVNFLCPRHLLEQAGGFEGREMIGDTLLSWELRRLKQPLRFAPDAIVSHDHRSTFPELVRERCTRGADFARLRMEKNKWGKGRTAATLGATVLPLRLAKLIARTFRCSLRANCAADFFRTSPVIVAGHAAWLAGEASQYWRRLVR